MKDTVKNFYIAHESVAAFIQSNSNVIIGRPALAITYNYRILTDALSDYVKMRNEIIAKYGTPDEEGNVTLVAGTEGHTKANEEIEKLESMEIEIFPMLLDMDDLSQISQKVPIAQLVNLMWMTKKYQSYKNGDSAEDGKRFTRKDDGEEESKE